MKNGLFEVGDIVRGIKGNRYAFTNEKMTKAIVVGANERTICVKVLEHTESSQRNGEHYVSNNTSEFELVEETQEDFWESLEVL